uniref:GRAM domain-containing protein n=1 Tax=Panagrellus redivivus TaxID=6233 RepID=A0A7E4W2U6_PANRE
MFRDIINKFLNAVNPRNCFGGGLYADIFEDQTVRRDRFSEEDTPQVTKPEEATTSVESWNNAFESAGSSDVEELIDNVEVNFDGRNELVGIENLSAQAESSMVDSLVASDSIDADLAEGSTPVETNPETSDNLDTLSIHTAVELEGTPETANTDSANQQSPPKRKHCFGFTLQNIASFYMGLYYSGDYVMNSRHRTKTIFEDSTTPGSRIQMNFDKAQLISVQHGDKVYYRFEELPSRVADLLVSARVISQRIGS